MGMTIQVSQAKRIELLNKSPPPSPCGFLILLRIFVSSTPYGTTHSTPLATHTHTPSPPHQTRARHDTLYALHGTTHYWRRTSRYTPHVARHDTLRHSTRCTARHTSHGARHAALHTSHGTTHSTRHVATPVPRTARHTLQAAWHDNTYTPHAS